MVNSFSVCLCSVFAADMDEAFLAGADHLVVLRAAESHHQFALLPRLECQHNTAVQHNGTSVGIFFVSV